MADKRDWDHGDSKAEKKKERDWEVTPKDLKKAGVQDTGLAMNAAKIIYNKKKEMEKALKELE